MKIFKKDCSPQDAEDKSLPVNSYLVSYIDEGTTKYDICISHKRVEIFDHYYDNFYKVLSIEWTKGSVNPKLWQDPNSKKKK